jgi:hypothetical protein
MAALAIVELRIAEAVFIDIAGWANKRNGSLLSTASSEACRMLIT